MSVIDYPTLILLDCHPDSHTPCTAGPEDSDKAISSTLWTCFVEATLEYCRVVFDLFAVKRNGFPVSVHVAGLPTGRNVLNSWKEQNVNQIANNFSYISPQLVSPSPLRIPIALEDAIQSLESYRPGKSKKAKFVIILMGKGGDEIGFKYRETREQKMPKDLRQIILDAVEKCSKQHSEDISPLEHCHFDILRVIPPNNYLTEDTPWTKLSQNISATIYNVSPERDSLTRAMIHLAQFHRRLNTLHLVGVPMKKTTQNRKMTYEIDLLYPAAHHVSYNIPSLNTGQKKRIFENGYLKDRQTIVRWCKRKNHDIDTLLTKCTHSIAPLDITHSPTSVLVQSLLGGSIQFFTSYSPSNPTSDDSNLITKDLPLTHMITCFDGSLYLHCLSQFNHNNIRRDDLMNKPIPPEVQMSKPLRGFPDPYISNFIRDIVQPNVFNPLGITETSLQTPETYKLPDNYFQQIKVADSNASDDTIIPSPENKIMSSHYFDWETRWWKGFLNKSGDDGIKLLSGMPVAAHEIISELKRVICTENPDDDSIENVNKILDQLLAMSRGSASTSAYSFESQKTAVMVLKQIRTLGEIFKSVSTKHDEISKLINTRIKPDGTENKQQTSLVQTPTASTSKTSLTDQKSLNMETSTVLQQLEHYKSMTVREQQDFEQPQSSSNIPLTQQATQPTQQQLQIGPGNNRYSRTGYHPDYYFHHKRTGGSSSLGGRHPRGFPKPVVQQSDEERVNFAPSPYLKIEPISIDEIAQEKDAYKRRLGDEDSFFYQYWNFQLERQTHNTNRKEFDARLSTS